MDAGVQDLVWRGLDGVITQSNLLPFSKYLARFSGSDSLQLLGSGLLGIPRWLMCDATVQVEDYPTEKYVTFTYHGHACSDFALEGSIRFHQFKSDSTTFWFKVNGLVITRQSDGRQLQLGTGAVWVYNWTHRLPSTLGPGSGPSDSVLQEVDGQVEVRDLKDPRGLVWTFDEMRTRVYKYGPQGMVITTNGRLLDSLGWLSERGDLQSQGNSQPFECRVVEPMVVEQSCGWQQTHGKWWIHSHTFAVDDSDINTYYTFGLDKQGNPASCPGPYYFKVDRKSQYADTSFMMPYQPF
jgi:hypothetical protein